MGNGYTQPSAQNIRARILRVNTLPYGLGSSKSSAGDLRFAPWEYIAYDRHMTATLVYRKKERLARGVLLDMVIWQLPAPMDGCDHRFKYRLYAGLGNACLVRYDNERGKGDHRHEGNMETRYWFVSIGKLLEDFVADVDRLGG